MATKAKMRHAAEPRQPAAEPRQPAGEVDQRDRSPQAACEQEIRRRAYEIYLERGAQPGHELEDWLQAERELTAIPSNSPA
jgi:hypothetical protein